MIDIPLDPLTEEFLSHLRSVINGETDPDPQLAARFTDFLTYQNAPLFAIRDDTAAYNPAIASIVSLLLQTMSLEPGPFPAVLSALLSSLPFAEISQYVPHDTILQVLRSEYAEICVEILAARCIVRDDTDAAQFVARNDVVSSLSRQYLTSGESPQVLKFVSDYVRKYRALCPANKWEFLAESKTEGLANLARYLDLVAVLRWYPSAEVASFAPGLLELDQNIISALDDLDLVTLSETCILLMPAFPADWLKSLITGLSEVFFRESALRSEDSLHRMVSHDFLRGLLVADEPVARYGVQLLANPHIADSYMENSKLPLFASLPLGAIPNKQRFFDEFFSTAKFGRVNPPKFAAMVHLIDNEDFFRCLVDGGKLSSAQLKDLQGDYLYEILLALASYDYGATYLLSELPDIVSSHLLVADRTLVNSQVWTMKRLTLYKLVAERDVDLGVWAQGLRDCLYEMDNGRRGNLAPQVAVASQTK